MKKHVSILVILAFLLSLAGCASVPMVPEEHQGAAKGAGIGAATGAVAGAVLGKDVKGAVLGGLVGGLIGGALGHYSVDREKDAASTAQKYNYQPAQGTRVTIEEAVVQPNVVQPGNSVQLQSTYALLAPDANAPVQVTEAFEIRRQGEVVGNPQAVVTHPAGTYRAALPLTLPANAAKGVYQVTTTISTPESRDTRITSFEVR
jgi:predicted lipid-binding transport protein (Tim44 family)